jgi:hypothetical protein
MSWTIDVPLPRGADGKPIEPVTGNSRVHWAERHGRHRAIREAAKLVGASARAHFRLPRAVEPRAVEAILWREKGRQFLDHDQAYAYVKPLLDGMVDAGWLVDDRPRWLPDYRVRQGRCGTGPGDLARVTFTVGLISLPVEAAPAPGPRVASRGRRTSREPRRAAPSSG